MVRISVIIPTRDRRADLQRCLQGLGECVHLLQERSPGAVLHEVLVVDDASRDPEAVSPARAAELPVRVLRSDTRQGAGVSRRIATAEAEGDVFAFLDDDAVPRGDWLAVCAALDARRPAATGRVLRFDAGLLSCARQARYDQRYEDLRAGEPVTFFAGGNGAVLADAFRAVGGFSREGTGGDNSLAAELLRRGTPVRFRPDLVIAHRNGKGWRRATRDAWDAGLAHPERLALGAGLRMVGAGAAGPTHAVREVNRALGAVHVAGRWMPARQAPCPAQPVPGGERIRVRT